MTRTVVAVLGAFALLLLPSTSGAGAESPAPDDDRITLQVSGGVTPSAAPEYMARIVNSTSGSSTLCTGTLISARWVITAAHCIDTGATTTVTLGRLNVNNPNEGITRGVVQKVFDPNWLAENGGGGTCLSSFCNYDVGLLKLDAAVPANWEVAPLPPAGFTPAPGTDEPIYRGYGLLSDNPVIFADQLQETRPGDFGLAEPCIPQSNMDEYWCFEKLAGARTEGGDSGGPWMLQRDSWILFAVHSGIVVSGPTTISVGTNVQDLSYLRSTAGIAVYPADTILRDQTTGDAWYVDANGYRLTVPTAGAIDCLVDAGATVVDLPKNQYSTVALSDDTKLCTEPGEATMFAVPASLEAIGSLTDAGAVTLLAAQPDGSADGSVALHQNSPGVPGGSEAGDRHGFSTVWADVNGDTHLDLVMGTPHESIGSIEAGLISVMFFDADGVSTSGQSFHQGSAGVPGGNEDGDLWGYAVAAGDFNQDGYDDVAVGAPGEDIGTLPDTGAVTILYGTPNGLTGTGSKAFHQGSTGVPGGNEAGDSFGYALGVAGGDHGTTVLLGVGSPFEDIGSTIDAGSVTLFAGTPSGLAPVGQSLYQGASASGARPSMPGASEARDRWGSAVAGDPDGVLAIGAPLEDIGSTVDAGAVTLYAGYDSTPRARTIHQGTAGVPGANETGDQWGASLAAQAVGGETVLAVGAPYENIGSDVDAGSIVIISNPHPDAAVSAVAFHQGSAGVPDSPEDNDRFGWNVAIDPTGAIMATAPGESIGGHTESGAITIFFGTPTDPDATAVVRYHQDSAGVPGANEAGDLWGS